MNHIEMRQAMFNAYSQTNNLILLMLGMISCMAFIPFACGYPYLLDPRAQGLMTALGLALAIFCVFVCLCLIVMMALNNTTHPDEFSLFLGFISSAAMAVSIQFSSLEVRTFLPYYVSFCVHIGIYGLIRSMDNENMFRINAFSLMGAFFALLMMSLVTSVILTVTSIVRCLFYSFVLTTYIYRTIEYTIDIQKVDSLTPYCAAMSPFTLPFQFLFRMTE